jgi:hypothetical protein
MRRTMSILQDIALHELARTKTEERRADVCALFSEIDQRLSAITPTGTHNRLREVMTSADFTYAIEEFVRRELVPGYERKVFNFESLVKPRQNVNYLEHTDYQDRAGVDDLELVIEKGQARPGSRDDAIKRPHRVYQWQKQYDFSHQALVNDDLQYFSDQAMKMGQAARRSLEKFVSRMYTNAVSIARLVAAGALYAQNGRLTSARISEARMGFNQRVDARNEPINARLAYIVGHSGLADTALQIQNSELVPELATNAANVVRTNWEWIEDPYIVGVAPNLPWYGFTNWRENNIIPFILSRLPIAPGPLILRKRSDIESITSILGPGRPVAPLWGDFESGNIVLKVLDIWGTYTDETEGNLYDVRGAYYSTGTVP